MLVRAVQVLAVRGWLYLGAACLCLMPVWLLRIRAPAVWSWTEHTRDAAAETASGDDLSLVVISAITVYACTFLAMSVIPYLVLSQLSRSSPRFWVWLERCAGKALVAVLLSPLLLLVSAVAFGALVVFGPSTLGVVVGWTLGLALPLYVVGIWLVDAQGAAANAGHGRDPAEMRRGSILTHRLRKALVAAPLLVLYLGLPFLAELVPAQVFAEATTAGALAALTLAEASLLVLWATVVSITWHDTYGRTVTVERGELDDAFD